jgi:hypothetical protein
MRRSAREQGFAPCLEAREFLDVAEGFDAIEEGVALEERRVGGVDQRIGGAVEEGAGALFLQRLLDAPNGSSIFAAAVSYAAASSA